MLSMPRATASRNETEQRCPVTRRPRRCASSMAAAQLLVADARVGLEPVDALVGPVADDAPRVLGRAHLKHLRHRAGARQVRPRDVHPGADLLALRDGVLEVQLAVGREGARGPDGGHAGREVEARGAVVELHPAAAGHVERVVVQADDAGNHRMPVERERPGAVRDVDRAVRADGGDPAVPEEDRPPGGGGTSRSVHQLHPGQSHRRVVYLDELPHPVGERRRGLRGCRQRSGEKNA